MLNPWEEESVLDEDYKEVHEHYPDEKDENFPGEEANDGEDSKIDDIQEEIKKKMITKPDRREALQQGFIMKEILGPPRSKRRMF